ncbi:hypothetical protein LLS1_37360 [Leifsonia sp. LS1]|uniref:putative quinol monooxygenase n=1 Tax=Leifsonia sp. LS1 TaxID=2828483 RepID=UPI001CFE5D7D|nr:antibiotic biosynthesis monooxygenase family protein [Leifsonia sp. LS1]GIT82067.1 hypothetical protein LLS1_37360 [Leifsonia sp. LS1]
MNSPDSLTRSSSTGVALIATFTAIAGHEDAAAQLLADYTSAVRSEPGCIQFEPYRDAATPSRFVVFERYEDESAFTDHLNSQVNAIFNHALAPHVAGASELQFLDSLPGGGGHTLPSVHAAGGDE